LSLNTIIPPLTPEQQDFVQHEVDIVDLSTVSTANNAWTTIAILPMVADSAVTSIFDVVAKRTDAYGYFSAQYAALLTDNAGTPEVVRNVSTIFRKTTQVGLNFRVQGSGVDFLFQVRGRSGQQWDWEVFSYGRIY